MKHCIHASEPLSEFIVRCEHVDANKQFGTHAHIQNCAICPFRQTSVGRDALPRVQADQQVGPTRFVGG